MAKAAATGQTTDWDRDAALTTARILLEIQAINFRPDEPYTFTMTATDGGVKTEACRAIRRGFTTCLTFKD